MADRHVVAIVQARLGSTRLPRKSLETIAGKPLILHVLERAAKIPGVHTTAAAIPQSDQELGRVIGVAGFPVYAGAMLDVLGRYAGAAMAMAADIVIRVTGDCPLLDPEIGGKVLALFFESRCDYVSNVAPGYVDGEDVEVFSASALYWAARTAVDPFDREHVTPWLRRNLHIATLQPETDRSSLKTSVDTAEDLARVRALVEG